MHKSIVKYTLKHKVISSRNKSEKELKHLYMSISIETKFLSFCCMSISVGCVVVSPFCVLSLISIPFSSVYFDLFSNIFKVEQYLFELDLIMC